MSVQHQLKEKVIEARFCVYYFVVVNLLVFSENESQANQGAEGSCVGGTGV